MQVWNKYPHLTPGTVDFAYHFHCSKLSVRPTIFNIVVRAEGGPVLLFR